MHPFGYFATIIYNEPHQSSYKGIKISDRNTGFEKTFSNERKCPVLDFAQLQEFLAECDCGCRWSSSYDHFLMDGDAYVEQYVKCNGDNPDDWEFVNDRNAIWNGEYDFAMISREELESFQELRKYVKDWKYENR